MKTKRLTPRRKLSSVIITLLIIGSTVGFVSVLYVLRQSLTPREAAHSEVKNDNPALETQVSKVAAQFMCACGNCSNESLDQCPCETAQRARQLIRTSILSGRPIRQVLAMVDSSFGGRIEKPAGKLEGDPDAAMSQRTEVLSHFRCPCGKCGMENLAECDCDHPRGGMEVRAFLDGKLLEKKYSPDQLIVEIEKVYGGKKF